MPSIAATVSSLYAWWAPVPPRQPSARRLVPVTAPVDNPPWDARHARLVPIALWPQVPTGLTTGAQPQHVTRLASGFHARLAQMFPAIDAALREALLTQLLTASWQAFAAEAATLAQAGGHYAPVLLVRFPTLGRTFSTRLGATTEPLIARLEDGGVGSITVDLDEDTNVLRLGGASVTLVNPGPAGEFAQLMDSFESGPLAQLPLEIAAGFVEQDVGGYFTFFTGVVDRWQVTTRQIQLSAIPKTRQEARPISLTVREVIALVTQEAGASPFPGVPAEALERVIPLYMGKATSTPLIPVGTNTYLTGFGVAQLNAIRDNDEYVPLAPAHGHALLFGGGALPYITVRGQRLYVVKLLYQVEEGHIISADINDASAPSVFPGAAVPWGGSSSVGAYDRAPRVRDNLLTNGGFETGNMSGFAAYLPGIPPAAVAEVVAWPRGTGKTHEGYYSLRVRSSNLSDEGEHRYTAEIAVTPVTVWTGRVVHVSFWYAAGSFLAAGDTPDAQVSSRLTVRFGGGNWMSLDGSPSFDQMAEFSGTFIPGPQHGGTLIVRCEGLSEAASADVYLDDFVMWQEDTFASANDDGIAPVAAMLQVFTAWLPTVAVDLSSFAAVDALRAGWRFVGVIENATDAWGLLNTMAAQCNAVLSKDRLGRYRLDALDAPRDALASFNPVANIVEDSLTRLSAPADNIYSSFFVDYAQNDGMMYLTPTETNLTDATALVAACAARALTRGGARELRVVSDLILDRFTATALLQANFSRYGITGDVLQWRSWLDALPLRLLDQVTIVHSVLPFGDAQQVELTGWHFLPDAMQVELVARGLPTVLPPPEPQLAPIARPILLTTPAGIPVGVSVLLYVTAAPTTTLNLASILVTGLAPSGTGTFAVSVYGTLVFTPASGFTGVATALYTIADTLGNTSNAATITIVVGVSSQLVVANPDSAEAELNTPVVFALLTNDSAVSPALLVSASLDLDPNTPGRQTSYEDPEHGTFAVDDAGTCTFTPQADYAGDAVAYYTVADDAGHVSNITTITVTTASLLVAEDDTTTTPVNTPIIFALLTNDSATPGPFDPASVDLDPETDERQTTWEDVGHGTFEVDDEGNCTFTPVEDYVGDAIATYVVSDTLGFTSNVATITVTVEGGEELAQACNFVFGNDIDDPSVDGGNDTGIHIINDFCYFPEVDTVMACSGDPSMVGGTGAVSGPGFNDVYTSSRLGNSVMNPYTSFLGTIDVTSGGHGVCAMTNMAAYDGLLYVAVTTSLDSDQTVNGPPAIFTVDNITGLDDDSYYATWVEAQEFATTFSRVGAMEQHNGNLYVALEPKLAGTNALAVWQFDGAAWSLQHSFGTGFSRLRAFFGVGSFLYAGVDGQLWFATAGVWAHAQTFTGAVDSLSFKDGLIYVNVRNGSNREIWRGSSDDNVFTLFHTLSGETGTLVGPMGTGMPHPDEVEGFLYVPVHEADGTKVYRWDGAEWTMDHDYGTDFLGVSTMKLTGQVLSLALPRRLHTSDPGGGNVPGCEIWGVNCYYPPLWDLTYDVAIVDFTSLITDEVIPAPPDATWDVATLSLDELVFPDLDLTLSVGLDGVITGDRTDTSYGGPYTTTYRCDDSLGRHWAGTFSITFTAG